MRLPAICPEAISLRPFDHSITRQAGSHLRFTTYEHGEHHLTIPQHTPLRIGTLSAILADVAAHFELTRAQLSQRLFG